MLQQTCVHKEVPEQGSLFVRGTVVWRKASHSLAGEIQEDFSEEVMAKLLYRKEKEPLCICACRKLGLRGHQIAYRALHLGLSWHFCSRFRAGPLPPEEGKRIGRPSLAGAEHI